MAYAYREKGTLTLLNATSTPVNVKLTANVSPLKWDKRSLYFHSSWRQEPEIYIHPYGRDDEEKYVEWNFATIEGRGVYKGDLLSLFNHAPRWYGEGDEKIWVDDDTFPSHFGTGTEDYYNSSWAPVVPFHTPFGGAPRADLASSHGYNAFFRTRNLDGIPFKEKFKFDIEMIGWSPGYADYAATTYWYGDYDSKAVGTSGLEEATRTLVPTPENPAAYKIENCIEFETLQAVSKSSPTISMEIQGMASYPGSKWSRASQLLIRGAKENDYVEFEFNNLENRKYRAVIYVTGANDYATIAFTINGKPAGRRFDGYSRNVVNSGPIDLGTFSPALGRMKLRVTVTGTNSQTRNAKYLVGLDCIQLIPLE